MAAPPAESTVARPAGSASGIKRFAIGGAWFFAIVSLIQLGSVIVTLGASPGEAVHLYDYGGDGPLGWGLSYTGVTGLIIAIIQTVVIAAALIVSSLPATSMEGYRRLGHALLIGWAAWWTGSVIDIAAVTGGAVPILQAGLLGVLTGCTCYRGVCGWSCPPPEAEPASSETNGPSDPIDLATDPVGEPTWSGDRWTIVEDDHREPPYRPGAIARVRHRLKSWRDSGRAKINAGRKKVKAAAPRVKEQTKHAWRSTRDRAARIGNAATVHSRRAWRRARTFAHKRLSKAAEAAKPKTATGR